MRLLPLPSCESPELPGPLSLRLAAETSEIVPLGEAAVALTVPARVIEPLLACRKTFCPETTPLVLKLLKLFGTLMLTLPLAELADETFTVNGTVDVPAELLSVSVTPVAPAALIDVAVVALIETEPEVLVAESVLLLS